MRQLLLFCIKLISFLIRFCGRRLSRRFFGILGWVWFDILRIRRKDIMEHLAIAFPEMSYADKVKLGRQSLVLTAANLADLFIIPYINQSWLDKYVIYEGVEHVENALEDGKGILMLGMHLGNGDLAANLIAMRNWPIYLITKFFKNKSVNDIWFSVRGAQGVNYIEPHGERTPFQILKALKANGLVVFVIDQFMGKPYGIETTFFGRSTGTAQGLALFYMKTKAPVVPVYCYEGRDGKAHVVFQRALNLSEHISDSKEATIQNLTQHFCDVVEQVISKHPAHWMWLHRRWKKFE